MKKMGFSQMMELLQVKNKGEIVLCNAGNFYIAIGKDAVLLNELLGLKLGCLKPEMCKVGFPISSLEKYIDKIQEKRYSYIVYYFDQQKEELEVLMEYKGKKKNEVKEERKNWYICSKDVKTYKKPDKYILALTKLYETEKDEVLTYLNKIDANLNTQRIYLRIMKKNRWIDEHKFKVAMEQIYEMGKILGGLIKYYAKSHTKPIS